MVDNDLHRLGMKIAHALAKMAQAEVKHDPAMYRVWSRLHRKLYARYMLEVECLLRQGKYRIEHPFSDELLF